MGNVGLGVFRLKGQPKRDGGIIVRSCKASQSPIMWLHFGHRSGFPCFSCLIVPYVNRTQTTRNTTILAIMMIVSPIRNSPFWFSMAYPASVNSVCVSLLRHGVDGRTGMRRAWQSPPIP